ncbi:MAG TPA: nucleoside transporter C-terminal domain-containing protein [Rhizomicrobium sp.]|jgi:CNT family concentrative nucleoside transporter|nr:nucleoside transporter C-terminal domain-containing protein [Rhizomicrobium sp.]
MPLLVHLQSALGIATILLVAWLFSENRRAFPWRTVVVGIATQAVLALLLLKVEFARDALFALNDAVGALTAATGKGTSFVFGYVGGTTPPFPVTNPNGLVSFAFGVLPLVIVISALSALLWHWRILPVIVRGIAFVIRKLMGLGGAVSLGSGATIFLGMVEAPLLIRPYLQRLTRSEMFILLTVGLASVAGTVFALYASILSGVTSLAAAPGPLGHILIASMMSLPGAIVVARIMIPDSTATDTAEDNDLQYRSSMDAIARGTEDGVKIWLQIVGMLIVIVALVALADTILAQLPAFGGAPLTLERMFGWLFAPVVWLFGVPWNEASTAGSLMGIKIILNELVAYLNLAALPAGSLDPRSTLIMVYAMCGFANLGSVGIMIAGMSTLIPGRRDEIVTLATRALLSGAMASGLTGSMIGLLPIM